MRARAGVHDAAGEGFGRNAEVYSRARPPYHDQLVTRFVERYGDGDVVEVGAGTGIFTGQLVDADVAVLAVEPVEAMRAKLIDRLPGVTVAEGTAESMPLDNACADTVVVAQAFHWFDFVAALDECNRVLRPGGHLVTVWNVKEGEGGWYDGYMAVIERYAGDTPRHRDMRWRAAIDADARFEAVDDWRLDHPRSMDADGVVGRALSTSFIAALPGDEQDRVAAELHAILAEFSAPFEFPYRAELQAWRKVSPPSGP